MDSDAMGFIDLTGQDIVSIIGYLAAIDAINGEKIDKYIDDGKIELARPKDLIKKLQLSMPDRTRRINERAVENIARVVRAYRRAAKEVKNDQSFE